MDIRLKVSTFIIIIDITYLVGWGILIISQALPLLYLQPNTIYSWFYFPRDSIIFTIIYFLQISLLSIINCVLAVYYIIWRIGKIQSINKLQIVLPLMFFILLIINSIILSNWSRAELSLGIYLMIISGGIFISCIFGVIVIYNRISKISFKELLENYIEFGKNILDELYGSEQLMIIIMVIFGILLNRKFSDMGFFLTFQDGFALIAVLLLAVPFQNFMGTGKTLIERKEHIISIIQTYLISAGMIFSIIGIKIKNFFDPYDFNYGDKIVTRISVYDIAVFGLLFLLIIIKNIILSEKIRKKIDKKMEFIFAIMIVFITIRMIQVTGGLFNNSIFSYLSIVSFLLSIILMFAPLDRIFVYYKNNIFDKASGNSRGKIIKDEVQKIVNNHNTINYDDFNDKIIDYYSSAIIYDYTNEWISTYITIAIIFYLLNSLINYLIGLTLEITHPNISNLITQIISAIFILTIFLGKHKDQLENEIYPTPIVFGEGTTFIRFSISKTGKMAQFLYYYIFTAILLSVFQFIILILDLEVYQFYEDSFNLFGIYRDSGFLIKYEIPSLIAVLLSLVFVIATIKLLIPKFMQAEFRETNKQFEKYNPLMLTFPFFVILPYFIIFRLNINIVIILVYDLTAILVLVLYIITEINRKITKFDKVLFVIINYILVISVIIIDITRVAFSYGFFMMMAPLFFALLFTALNTNLTHKIGLYELREKKGTIDELLEYMKSEIHRISKIGRLGKGIILK